MSTRKIRSVVLAISLALGGCGGASPSAVGAGAAQTAAKKASDVVSIIKEASRPILGGDSDYSDVLPVAGRARRVLLGESTHGTHEYYRERARISERLIRDYDFNAVAIEGDWSSTQRANLYVRGLGSDRSAAEALSGFRNFPRWMWPNVDFRNFVERLREYNLTRPEAERVGLYGMDVYDLFDASEAVLAYLRQADPAAAERAQLQYRCFAPYRRSTHEYGEATRDPRTSCEDEAEAVIAEVERLPRPSAPREAEMHFAALRSAASVAGAEEYFRTVYTGSLAWNVRDQRMAQNVEAIADHVARVSGREGKIVMWSHNTHSGDARATFAANRGELNIGQLMRQKHGNDAFLVGFFSYAGTVFAAPEWEASGRVYDMRPALSGSYSELLHRTGLPSFSLLLRGNEAVRNAVAGPLLERAIGVVYVPATERQSHYFEARLPEQFDAAIFFDRSSAITPLRT